MVLVAFFCVSLVGVTTVIHYEVLRGLVSGLPALRMPARMKLLVVIFVAFVAHMIEITLYSVTLFVLVRYFGCGELSGTATPSISSFMYFSTETYTSLGFGDVVPVGPIRMLAGIEALNGLLLIGWSASFCYITMERFWNDATITGRDEA